MKLSIIECTIVFCSGVSLGILYGHSSLVLLLLGVCAFVQMVLLFVAKIITTKTRIALPSLILSVLCALGIIRGQMYEEIVLPKEIQGVTTSFIGEVRTLPTEKETTQVVDLRIVEGEDILFPKELEGKFLRITLPLYPKAFPGDRLSVTGKIEKGDVVLPVPRESFTSFNYPQYLHTHAIVGTMIFPHSEVATSTEEKSLYDHTRYTLFSFKEKMTTLLAHAIPTPANALVNGVLFGTNTFPKQIQDEVRIAGLSHIVVLSGFNVAILVAFIMYVFRYLPLSLRIILSTIFISLFVIMTGGGASLVRAAIMAYVALLSLYIGRQYQALYALFFSLFIYVVTIPESLLYDVSLQLSFLATLGLILFTEPIKEFLKEKSKLCSRYDAYTTLVASTLGVMLTTTPYIMYTFSSFSLYSIIANILVVPVVPLLMALGALFLVVSVVPLLGACISFLAYGIASYVIAVAHYISFLPYAKITMTMSFSTMIFLYGVIGICMYIFLRTRKMTKVSPDPSIISF